MAYLQTCRYLRTSTKGLNVLHIRKLSSMKTRKMDENRVKSMDEVPGPLSIPFFKSAWLMPVEMIRTRKPLQKVILDLQLALVAKYGRIVKQELPGINIVGVADPEAASAIFQNEPKYPKRLDMPVFDYYRETRQKIPGVFFAEGQEWYKHRSVISKRLLRPKEVADYIPVLNEIGTDFISRLTAIRGSKESEFENEVRELDKELFKWSFESVAHVLFEKRFGCFEDPVNPEAQDFIKSVGAFLAANINVVLLPAWIYKYYETKSYKEFVRHYDNMYHWAELFIERKLKGLEEQEKLGNEVKANEERVEFFRFLLSSGKITKDDILASVIDLLFAGVDTTSNTMIWALYMMGKNPEKQAKLSDEIRSVLKPGELPTAKSLAKMPYLKAWIRETLRLYPVLISFGRILPHDTEILGYNIRAGTQVNLLTYFMGRDEKLFKEADKFKPERWLRNERHQLAEDIHPFSSIPFGFGIRMCLGRRIAETELHLLIVRIVQKFDVQFPHEEEVEPYCRGLTIPDRPVRVKFVDRQQP